MPPVNRRLKMGTFLERQFATTEPVSNSKKIHILHWGNFDREPIAKKSTSFTNPTARFHFVSLGGSVMPKFTELNSD